MCSFVLLKKLKQEQQVAVIFSKDDKIFPPTEAHPEVYDFVDNSLTRRGGHNEIGKNPDSMKTVADLFEQMSRLSGSN